jgi:hypothetical protein
MKPDNSKVIEQLVDNTRTLLEEHWRKVEQTFAGTISITMKHVVDFDEGDTRTKTTIGFGERIKDEIEVSVRDPEEELPMDIPKAPRKRKPTLETTVTFGGDAA